MKLKTSPTLNFNLKAQTSPKLKSSSALKAPSKLKPFEK